MKKRTLIKLEDELVKTIGYFEGFLSSEKKQFIPNSDHVIIRGI